MTREEIKRAREVCDTATPGPWERIEPNADDGDIRVQIYYYKKRNVVIDAHSIAWKLERANADFIAESRTLLPKALSHIEELERKLQIAVEALEKIQMHCVCHRFTTLGFDYDEIHEKLGKPKLGARWLTPLDLSIEALEKLK